MSEREEHDYRVSEMGRGREGGRWYREREWIGFGTAMRKGRNWRLIR